MKPGSKRQKLSYIQKDEDKNAKAAVFQLERIKGKTLVQIAEDYNCSVTSVENYLKRARDQNLLLSNAQRIAGHKLLPLALAVLESHLLDGSLEAAQDVLYGMGVLSKTATVKHQSQSEDDTLDSFRERFFQAQAKAVDVVLSAPKGALPPAAEVVAEVKSEPPVAHLQDGSPEPYESIDFRGERPADLHDQTDEDGE